LVFLRLFLDESMTSSTLATLVVERVGEIGGASALFDSATIAPL